MSRRPHRMPATTYFDLSPGLAGFGIARFDRAGEQRVPVHSLAGLLHADFRLPSLDYTTFLRATRLMTRDQREVEQAFAHDEEVRFLVLTHRDKLFGRWAADLLRYEGEVAERYVQSLVDTISEPAGAQAPDDRIVSRVSADFANAGVQISAADVRSKLLQFQEESKAAIGASRS